MNFHLRKILFLTFSVLSILGYGFFVFAAPPGPGGYNPGETLDPECTPGDLLPEPCIVKSSNWSLSGNSGTTAGTNFIGTTDLQDFMVKTNGNQIALFGQNGNVAVGSTNAGFGSSVPNASGSNSFAVGMQTEASGIGSVAFGYSSEATAPLSFVWGDRNTANGLSSTAWGLNNTASYQRSTAWGTGNESSAINSTAWGAATFARSYSETAFGINSTDYTPNSISAVNFSDRLLTIGNGLSGNAHNAYTLWKDGSFAYNDDNFQNDNLGTEQNMFYFNYGNHDGLGVTQTKRAIRLGSAINDEWDINSGNVGDRSIAMGFGGGIAQGSNSFAFGEGVASGDNSVVFNRGQASGSTSFAWGKNAVASGGNSFAFSTGGSAVASGNESWALGSSVTATGDYSKSFGQDTNAYSFGETVFGRYNTVYVPNDSTDWNTNDRLFNIANGNGSTESDAFTILKNGQTGIAIDNFEANTNGNIFQVGDGSTNVIGYVDNGTGNWVAVSDERKKDNITDLTYGLNELMKLRPTSFNYKRNNEHTIGFLAQQVLPIIPEAVYGTESEGYGMSYTTLTPVIVKAIQEMNLNITQLSDMTRENTWRDSLIEWFGTATNGITKLFAGEVHTDTLCVGQTCVTESQLQQLLQNQNITYTISTPTELIEEADNTDPVADPVSTTDSVNTEDSNQEITVEEPVVDISDNLETSAPVLGTPTE